MTGKNLPEVWEVRWEDSTCDHGWNKDKAARTTSTDTITSVGFLVNEDKDCIRMTGTAVAMPLDEVSWHSRFDCVTTIPRSAVRSMKRLKKAKS